MTARRPARRRYRDLHIFRDSEHRGWVLTEGRRRLSVHQTQAEAICAGIRRAKRTRVDVVTHGRNGQIRSKDSYGNESRVRDTEH